MKDAPIAPPNLTAEVVTGLESGQVTAALAVPFSEFVREQQIHAADETIELLAKTIRSTRTVDGKIRRAKVVAAVLALRMEGFTVDQSARLLGLTKHQVSHALEVIRKDGTISGQMDRLDAIAVALAVDNVIQGVKNGDKDYTLKVLEGRGVFRTHKSVEEKSTQTVMTLTVSMEGVPLVPPEVKAGSIVGHADMGKLDDGLTIDAKALPSIVGMPDHG
jgi:predicted transcriptional regulator